ncbi:MAG: metallophosphoesterase [Xanthomonadales bacterium]|nr:metallophosphoesterase [Xanthomonadales bacterium]
MKWLHTADWQIGRIHGFASDGDGRDPNPALAAARFEVVERLAALARGEAVDAVFVAGDVFDQQGVADTTLRRLVNAMQGFEGPWLLLPGNHDAALADSVWKRLQRLAILPANVHLLLEPGVREFPEAGFAVLAAPLVQRHTRDDLTAWFDGAETPAGLARVGIAHGSVAGVLPEAADSPNPVAAGRAASARLDYLALGDWHGARRVDGRTWYSGTPEQERFKDNDPGNVLLVELDAPGAEPRVRSQRVGRFRWHECSRRIDGSAALDDLATELARFGPDDVLRLSLAGMLDVAGNARLGDVLDAARARLHVLEADASALRLEPTAADLAALQVDGVLAGLVEELRGMQEPAGSQVAGEALKILFDAVRRRRIGA